MIETLVNYSCAVRQRALLKIMIIPILVCTGTDISWPNAGARKIGLSACPLNYSATMVKTQDDFIAERRMSRIQTTVHKELQNIVELEDDAIHAHSSFS